MKSTQVYNKGQSLDDESPPDPRTPVKYDNTMATKLQKHFERSYKNIAAMEKEIEEDERNRRQSIVDNLFHPPSPLIDPRLQHPVPKAEDDAWYEKHRYHAPELEPLSKGAKAFGIGAVLILAILFFIVAWFITSLPN